MRSTSRAAWIRERQACVAQEIHNDKNSGLAATPSLSQQHHVQGDLPSNRTRKFEALEFKHLCSHEIDSDFQADASAFFFPKTERKNKRCPEHLKLMSMVRHGQYFAQCHKHRKFTFGRQPDCFRRFQRTQQLDWRGKVHSSLQEKTRQTSCTYAHCVSEARVQMENPRHD